MIIGYHTVKDKEIKWYSSASIDHINEKGDRAVLNLGTLSDDRESTKAIITYNPKFESAVIEIKSPVKNVTKNIHRIQSISLDHEINPIKQQVDKDIGKMISNTHLVPDLYFADGDNFLYSINNHELQIKNGKMVRNTLSWKEYSRVSRSYYISTGKHLPLYEYKTTKEEKFLDKMTELWNNKKDQKTMKYPLIYKLKEREDYKELKKILDNRCDNILCYNHINDKFYLTDSKNKLRVGDLILDVYRA